MTKEELIKNIKGFADKDGVVSLKKDSKERYYLAKLVGKNDGLLINEWVKQNTGLVMYVKGRNDGEVILHRLRKNGLLKIDKTKNSVRETLYAIDLIVSEDDKSELAIIKNRLRRQIKEQASGKKISAEEYVIQYLGIDYVPKNKVSLRDFRDVDKWIEQNIKGTNADTLRDAEGFVNVRDWLVRNWKIENRGVISAFADYIISKYPEYSITAHVKVNDKDKMFKNILLNLYPNKVISNLKTNNSKLYHMIYSYRREIPNGHTMSMKQMIEDYIGNGELKYITDVNVRTTKYTPEVIKYQLESLFGKGDVSNPVVVKGYENGVVNNEKRRLLQVIRSFCKGNEISVEDFLKAEGYVGYKYTNKKAKPAKRAKGIIRQKNTHNEGTIKIRYGAMSDKRKGRDYEIVGGK